MSEQPQGDVKCLFVTKQEAELISDSLKVTNPVSRTLALKAMGLVLEYAAEDGVKEAKRLHQIDKAG